MCTPFHVNCGIIVYKKKIKKSRQDIMRIRYVVFTGDDTYDASVCKKETVSVMYTGHDTPM